MRGRGFLLLLAGTFFLLAGCAVTKADGVKKKEREFIIADKERLPESLKAQIKRAKDTPFRFTFGDGDYLYAARGYGEQKSSGYSIRVREVYETGNTIRIKTELEGPRKGEEIVKRATSPYIAIKMKYSKKRVIFE